MELYVSNVEERILVFLVGNELYGLEIIDATNLSVGSVYPALHKLEIKGLICSRWDSERLEERDYNRRRYYTATELGKQTLGNIQQSRLK